MLPNPCAIGHHFQSSFATSKPRTATPFWSISLPVAIVLPQSLSRGNTDGFRLMKCSKVPLEEHIHNLHTLLSYLRCLQKVAPLTSSVMVEDPFSCDGWKSHSWRFERPWIERRIIRFPSWGIRMKISRLSSAVHNTGYFCQFEYVGAEFMWALFDEYVGCV